MDSFSNQHIICRSCNGLCIFYVDNEEPTISLKDTPVLACDIEKEDLLSYAQVNDENLKNFFIEEQDLATIAQNGGFTYVAIDNKNNISKLHVDVLADNDINDYHIEVINDLVLPIRNNLLASRYFALKNKCGWAVRDSFVVSGVDRKTAGIYNATIKSRKYDSDDINVLFEVEDPNAPKIILSKTEINVATNEDLDYDFFYDLIDEVKDDKNSERDLVDFLQIDYQEVIKTRFNGNVEPGKYLITYAVQDNDGNIGKATLRVNVGSYYNEVEDDYE